jgi:hypothetical protein
MADLKTPLNTSEEDWLLYGEKQPNASESQEERHSPIDPQDAQEWVFVSTADAEVAVTITPTTTSTATDSATESMARCSDAQKLVSDPTAASTATESSSCATTVGVSTDAVAVSSTIAAIGSNVSAAPTTASTTTTPSTSTPSSMTSATATAMVHGTFASELVESSRRTFQELVLPTIAEVRSLLPSTTFATLAATATTTTTSSITTPFPSVYPSIAPSNLPLPPPPKFLRLTRNTSTGTYASVVSANQGATTTMTTSTTIPFTSMAHPYRSQLERLHEMGFEDDAKAVTLLEKHQGNLKLAVEDYLKTLP